MVHPPSERELSTVVVGRRIESTETALTTSGEAIQAAGYVGSDTKRGPGLIVISCIAVAAIQAAGYVGSDTTCERFQKSRFERLLWLSPLYFLGPWSAMALVATFVHRPQRFSHQLAVHRWTWRFALLNLVASLSSALSEMFLECSCSQSMRKVGEGFEILWIASYGASEFVLLGLVYLKVRSLGHVCASQSLLGFLSFLLALCVLAFLPTLFWHGYIHSPLRLLVAICYISALIVSLLIATISILKAAHLAEHSITKTMTIQKRAEVCIIVSWTRWSAYAILSSMASSVLFHGVLCLWMYNGYLAGPTRILADWLGALDYVMNSWCAATLSGMIGPVGNLNTEGAALREAEDSPGSPTGRESP